jgi:hypothetical protein
VGSGGGGEGEEGQSEKAGWGFLSLLAFKMTTYERPPLTVSARPSLTPSLLRHVLHLEVLAAAHPAAHVRGFRRSAERHDVASIEESYLARRQR